MFAIKEFLFAIPENQIGEEKSNIYWVSDITLGTLYTVCSC